MFQTTKFSSSGRLVHAALWYYIMQLYKQSCRCQNIFDTNTSWQWLTFQNTLSHLHGWCLHCLWRWNRQIMVSGLHVIFGR